MDSSASTPFSPIENTSALRRTLPDSSRKTATYPSQTKDCEEIKKENSNEHRIENIEMLMMSSKTNIRGSINLKNKGVSDFKNHMDIEPSEYQEISKVPFLGLSQTNFTKDHEDLDDLMNVSFLTQETAPESDSESEDMDSCVCLASGDTEDNCNQCSLSVTSRHGVFFADEIGLPIHSILHYECDRSQREHSELQVLCICPEQKTFEFLHIGYHQNSHSSVSIEDLLRNLPGMCTNPVFGSARFVGLYRNNGFDQTFENLCVSATKKSCNEGSSSSESIKEKCSLPLQDCGFRENEMIVAAIQDSSESAVLAGIGPLLGNEKILKTLKRARRSRRGLKFVRGRHEEEQDRKYHLQKRLGLLLRRGQMKTESKEVKAKHSDATPKLELKCKELVDEFCYEYDNLQGVTEYHKQLLFGILAIWSGTIVLSALGF